MMQAGNTAGHGPPQQPAPRPPQGAQGVGPGPGPQPSLASSSPPQPGQPGGLQPPLHPEELAKLARGLDALMASGEVSAPTEEHPLRGGPQGTGWAGLAAAPAQKKG